LNQNTDTLLVADGEAASVMDYPERKRRPSTYKDWLTATRLLDTIDEVGVYWAMVEGHQADESIAGRVRYWQDLFSNFSKHIQDPISEKSQAPWFLEVLQIIFGDQETIRKEHPVSFLVCPQSPLILDEQYTEACLALAGWDIPVAIMPMPLMGSTSPGTLVSMLITGNCEVLAMICLLQAKAPGWPVIYAPVFAASNPRTGLYSAGAIENAISSVAAVELARYYKLPAEGTGGGTDHYFPGIQAGFERAMTAMLPAMARPDLLVGPGLLGGSTVLSLEQLVIDVEIFRMSRYAARGIDTVEERWLLDDISRVGAGGHFLGSRSTAEAIRDGEWFHPKIGLHDTLETWKQKGRRTLLDEAHAVIQTKLKEHKPLPLPEEVDQGLSKLLERARLEDEKVS
jgi:trimethylamine--corrinoid protein Co-methyltransferase